MTLLHILGGGILYAGFLLLLIALFALVGG